MIFIPTMYLLSLLSLVGLVAASLVCHDPAPLSDAEIDCINSLPGITWEAGRNFGPNDMHYVKKLLGTDLEAERFHMRHHMSVAALVDVDVELPENFDARQKWPNCDSFKEIRDQSACGSCWAHATAAAISDRICVATGENVYISAEDIASCCTINNDRCGQGCNGGATFDAWAFYYYHGVVTGGHFNSSQGCRPHSLRPCGHNGTGPLVNCDQFNFTMPECQRACRQGYPKTYQQDKHYASATYQIEGVYNIMQQIYTKGAVTADMMVYSDFFSYKSGVYKHVIGEAEDNHAVKILGWGVENGVDYWLVANSWNTHWGDKGFFKIARGMNECDIESIVLGGDPRE